MESLEVLDDFFLVLITAEFLIRYPLLVGFDRVFGLGVGDGFFLAN